MIKRVMIAPTSTTLKYVISPATQRPSAAQIKSAPNQPPLNALSEQVAKTR